LSHKSANQQTAICHAKISQKLFEQRTPETCVNSKKSKTNN